MKNTVVFRDNQELDADDLNNIQAYARSSFDTLTTDAIAMAPAYAGFVVSKTAATQVTVTAGRFYDAGGAAWELATPSVIDFFSLLPLVTQKWVALTVNGSDIQTNVEPRDFLIDATTGRTQPQSVAMEESRLAVVNTVAGVEAPQPSYPSTPSTVTVIAYVLLATTGVQQIAQYAPTQLPNLQTVEGQVTALQTWQSAAGAQINSLATALTALKTFAKGLAAETEVQTLTNAVKQLNIGQHRIAARLDTLAALVSHLNPVAVIVEQFDFIDFTGCDNGNGAFTAVINEGICFPGSAAVASTLGLLNPLDVNASVSSNFLLPTFTSVRRLSCSGYSAQLQLSQFAYLSGPTYTQWRRQRRRHRCGRRYAPSPATSVAKAASYDPISINFAFTSESFTVVTMAAAAVGPNGGLANPASTLGAWKPCRQTAYWQDDYTEPFWNRVTTTFTATGQHVAQVFLNAQDGWITQLGLFFTQAALTGNVTISLCHVDTLGHPDITSAIQTVTLAVGSILTGSLSSGAGLPVLVETQVTIPPTFLTAGRRYAVVVATPGAHYLAMTQTDWAVLQGQYFWADSTGNFNPDSTQQIRLNLYYASWASTRYEIQLQPLSLAGGIEAIDVLTEAHVPTACSLEFHVQISGVWYPLAASGVGPNLAGLPALLPLKAVFIGTTDLMPGHALDGRSQVGCLGTLASSYVWLSTSRTLGGTTQNVKVTVILVNWVPAYHTATIRLKVSSTYYTATTVTDVLLPDGTYSRECYFAPGTGLTAYLIQIDGSTSSAGNVFQIARLTHAAS